MDERIIKIKIGNYDYVITIIREKGFFFYELKRGKKVLKVTTYLVKHEHDIKMDILADLQQQAFYEIRNALKGTLNKKIKNG